MQFKILPTLYSVQIVFGHLSWNLGSASRLRIVHRKFAQTKQVQHQLKLGQMHKIFWNSFKSLIFHWHMLCVLCEWKYCITQETNSRRPHEILSPKKDYFLPIMKRITFNCNGCFLRICVYESWYYFFRVGWLRIFLHDTCHWNFCR